MTPLDVIYFIGPIFTLMFIFMFFAVMYKNKQQENNNKIKEKSNIAQKISKDINSFDNKYTLELIELDIKHLKNDIKNELIMDAAKISIVAFDYSILFFTFYKDELNRHLNHFLNPLSCLNYDNFSNVSTLLGLTNSIVFFAIGAWPLIPLMINKIKAFYNFKD